jgi:hypothetical protein
MLLMPRRSATPSDLMITGCKQLLFSAIQLPWPPDWTDRMNYILCGQVIGFGCLGIASLTAIQGQALFLQFLTCRLVDRAIDTPTAYQRISRRIDDCIDLQLGDVTEGWLQHVPCQILPDA